MPSSDQSDPSNPTALEALRPLGESSVEIATEFGEFTPSCEIYTAAGC